MPTDSDPRIQFLERQNRRWRLLAITGWLTLLVACTLLGLSRLSGIRTARALEQEARMMADLGQQRAEQAEEERQQAEAARQEALRQRDQAEKARREAAKAAKKAKDRVERQIYLEQIRLAQQKLEQAAPGSALFPIEK